MKYSLLVSLLLHIALFAVYKAGEEGLPSTKSAKDAAATAESPPPPIKLKIISPPKEKPEEEYTGIVQPSIDEGWVQELLKVAKRVEPTPAEDCEIYFYYGIGVEHDSLFNRISKVHDGYPAQKAGILEGDVVLGWTDQDGNYFPGVGLSSKDKAIDGTIIMIHIERMGSYLTIPVTRSKVCAIL